MDGSLWRGDHIARNGPPGRLQRGLIEFLVIATSVLAALLADSWREGQIDRRSEATYVDRLVVDLDADVQQLAAAVRRLTLKREPLSRLISVAYGEVPMTSEQMAQDLAEASSMAWNFTRGNQTTFREMQSTGGMALVRSSDVRSAIAEYYARYDDIRGTIEARRTSFGPLSYELVRRSEITTRTAAGDFEASELSSAQLAALQSPRVLEEVRRAATAELNFAGYSILLASQLEEAAASLSAQLIAYRAELR